MLTFEEVGKVLDVVAEELPKEFFRDLNGGILLLPEVCQDDGDSARGLYTLGEYVHDEMGRYIIIYYGSFVALYKNLPPEKLRKELKETLIHEFTHHIESLAGECGLEIEDELEMMRFRAKRGRARRGYALASVVALMFFLTILLGMAVSHVNHSAIVMEAHTNRFHARNALESMTNISLKWLSAEIKSGTRPRAQAIIDLKHLTDFDSLRIFTWIDFEGAFDGGEVRVYDLDYAAEKIVRPVNMSRIFPPSLPGGYMIRAVVERRGLAPMMLESVYVVTPNVMPGGLIVDVLDEKPVYTRELFRK